MTTGDPAARALPGHRGTVAATWAVGASYELTEAVLPHPIADQILVDVDAVGVCHADLAARDGAFPVPLPAVLGHEGTGTVRAIGPTVRNIRVGDRVVLTFDSCQRCQPCRSGRFTHCDHYMQMNFGTGTGSGTAQDEPVIAAAEGNLFAGFFGQSSFGTLALASERNAVVINVDVPAHLLAPLGCAVQTGAGAVLNVGQPRRGAVVAIIGLGPVGFSALTAAAHFTPAQTIIAIDLHAGRLKLAQDLAADITINAGEGHAFEHLKDIGGADLIVECSGAPHVLPAALAGVRTGGTLVIVGVPPFGTTAPLDVADVANRSITIRGTVEGDSQPNQMIPWLAAMVSRGRWPLAEIVNTYPLSDIEKAVDDMSAGRIVKPVLIP